jgi:hypothetical protein
VVSLHVFGGKHVLAVGRIGIGILAAGLIERVHLKRPLHGDGFLIAAVEPDSAPEAAHGFLAVGVQHGVLPDGDELHGPREFAVLAAAPGDVLAQVELRASPGRQQRDAGQREDTLTKAIIHEFPQLFCVAREAARPPRGLTPWSDVHNETGPVNR